MAEFDLFDSAVTGSWYCACRLTVTSVVHGLLGHLNKTEPLLMLLATPVLFPTMTSQNVCCEKGLTFSRPRRYVDQQEGMHRLDSTLDQ